MAVLRGCPLGKNGEGCLNSPKIGGVMKWSFVRSPLPFAGATFLFVTALGISHACDLLESYSARLGEADHFNSNGERLTSAAAIIRQDRANFYLFGIRDSEDEPDQFFASRGNRARLEWMLNHGETSSSATRRIVNGMPIIHVDICRGKSGNDYVNVTVE